MSSSKGLRGSAVFKLLWGIFLIKIPFSGITDGILFSNIIGEKSTT